MSDTPNNIPPDEPPPTPSPSPAPAPAPTEPDPVGEPEGQPRDEAGRFKAAEESRFDRRIGTMRAQLSLAARQRDELAARLAQLEQRVPQQAQPQIDPQLAAYIDQQAEQKAQARIMQQRAQEFHQAGAARFPDWQQRCNDLQAMGADAQLAQLLVEMPDGAKIAGALRDDPEELERIAAVATERGRAIALGTYAARLEATPTRQVSRAPAPPKPLPGRSSPSPNPYMMDANELAAHWMREALEAQKRR